MKFNFKLEAVLNIRKHEEELEKQKLGALMQRKKNIQNSLMEVQKALNDMNGRYLSEIKTDMINLRKYYAFLQDKQDAFWELKGQLEAIDNQITDQRHALLEANKQTRMIEKLKSKALIAYVSEMEHKEQLEINEMATQRYNHSN